MDAGPLPPGNFATGILPPVTYPNLTKPNVT